MRLNSISTDQEMGIHRIQSDLFIPIRFHLHRIDKKIFCTLSGYYITE